MARDESKDQRQYDGRLNYPKDDEVEGRLQDHFERFTVSHREVCRNFPIYARRLFLKRFLAHYELWRLTADLPGDVVELGVYRGVSLMSWANFLEVRAMGDRAKQVIGFDNWAGFRSFEEKDGATSPKFDKVVGGYDGGTFHEMLLDAIDIFDGDRFIPHKPRIVLVDGDIEESVPRYIAQNPGLRISLLHIDCDLYRPTKVAMEHLWDRVVRGGVVVLDDYGIRPWEGETTAVDEWFAGKPIRIKRFEWSHIPGGYIIKD